MPHEASNEWVLWDLDRRLMDIPADLLGVWETIHETERAMRSGAIPKADG